MLYTLVCPRNCSFTLSNESTITLLPFTSTSGDLDISIELSLRPLVTVTVDLLDELIEDTAMGATAYVDAPKLDLQVSTVHNVTASCDPAPSSAGEDDVFPSLINIAPSWGIDRFFIAMEGKHNVSFTPSYTVHNFTNICLEFNSTTHMLGPPAQQHSTKTTKSSSGNLGNPVFGCLVAWVIAVLIVM